MRSPVACWSGACDVFARAKVEKRKAGRRLGRYMIVHSSSLESDDSIEKVRS